MALEKPRFEGRRIELLRPMRGNLLLGRKLFAIGLVQGQMAHGPRISRGFERFFERGGGFRLSPEKALHARRGRRRAGDDAEILEGAAKRAAVAVQRTVVIEPEKEIGGGAPAQFGKEHSRQVRRAVDLLEGRFERGAERIRRQSAQRNVVGGAGEAFGAGEFNSRHAQALEVARVADRAQSDAVVDLEDFSGGRARR